MKKAGEGVAPTPAFGLSCGCDSVGWNRENNTILNGINPSHPTKPPAAAELPGVRRASGKALVWNHVKPAKEWITVLPLTATTVMAFGRFIRNNEYGCLGITGKWGNYK